MRTAHRAEGVSHPSLEREASGQQQGLREESKGLLTGSYHTTSLYTFAVFPPATDWFLPANGFHSYPSGTATLEGRRLPANSSLKNPRAGSYWASLGHVTTLGQQLWPSRRGDWCSLGGMPSCGIQEGKIT